MLKFNNQPDINLDSIALIRKDESFYKDPPYAIMFYWKDVAVEGCVDGLHFSVWTFETIVERDMAYRHVCKNKVVQEEFDMSPVRINLK